MWLGTLVFARYNEGETCSQYECELFISVTLLAHVAGNAAIVQHGRTGVVFASADEFLDHARAFVQLRKW